MKSEYNKILVVDDEIKIVEAVKAYLENSGYTVFTAYDGAEAVNQFERINPDLVVLDLMLPKISGEEVCKRIRKQSRIPIIMLTAKVHEDDKINGFNIGADDFMTKPFSPRELVVRIGSLLRRCSDGISPLFNFMSWNNGDLEINFNDFIIKKKGQDINLTPTEFKILAAMIKYPKKIFTREELIEIALGLDYEGFDRTVDSHIKNLRSKIEADSSNPIYIITIRGIGYKFGGEDS